VSTYHNATPGRLCGGCPNVLPPNRKVFCSNACRLAGDGYAPPPGRPFHAFRPRASKCTPEFRTSVCNLWADGMTLANIALRHGVTKNSIVGYVHRWKLPPRPSPIRRDGNPRAPRLATAAGTKRTNSGAITGQTLAPLASLARKAPPSMPTRHTPSIVPVRPPAPLRTPEQRVPRPNQPQRQCAWLDGDKPHWRQCEAVAKSGSPYCEVHHKRAYVRIRDLREDYAVAAA